MSWSIHFNRNYTYLTLGLTNTIPARRIYIKKPEGKAQLRNLFTMLAKKEAVALLSNKMKDGEKVGEKETSARHIFQRQNTRLGLTSDDSAIGHLFETYLDEFLTAFIFPALCLIMVLLTLVEINPYHGIEDRVVRASLFVGTIMMSFWTAAKYVVIR